MTTDGGGWTLLGTIYGGDDIIGTQNLDCGQTQIQLEMSTLLSATSKVKNLDKSGYQYI